MSAKCSFALYFVKLLAFFHRPANLKSPIYGGILRVSTYYQKQFAELLKKIQFRQKSL
jgi:hypothetical protein